MLLLAPVASAETLSSFEEPRKGVDALYPFDVTADEAGEARAVIYRNTPGRVFGLVVYDDTGKEIWVKNGTRGIQTLPAFSEGRYSFFIRGDGAFQVTDKFLDRKGHATIPYVLNTTARLDGTDAYAMAPSQNWTLDVEGNVTVEFWDLSGPSENLTAPFNRTMRWGSAYVLTVRGADDEAYTLGFTPTTLPPPEPKETPAPALPLAFAAVALALVAGRRLRRRT